MKLRWILCMCFATASFCKFVLSKLKETIFFWKRKRIVHLNLIEQSGIFIFCARISISYLIEFHNMCFFVWAEIKHSSAFHSRVCWSTWADTSYDSQKFIHLPFVKKKRRCMDKTEIQFLRETNTSFFLSFSRLYKRIMLATARMQ